LIVASELVLVLGDSSTEVLAGKTTSSSLTVTSSASTTGTIGFTSISNATRLRTLRFRLIGEPPPLPQAD
jgi:hypothetical protein